MMMNKLLMICITLIWLSSASASQAPSKNLVINVSPFNHTGEEFIAPPKGLTRAVYYPGEEIKLRITLINDENKQDIMLTLPEIKITYNVTIRWVKLPDGASESALKIQPAGVYKGLDITRSAQIENLTKLGPHEAVSSEWRLALRNGIMLIPGEYEFKVSYTLPAGIQQRLMRSGEKVVVHGTSFRFEVREPSTFEDQLERMYRGAARDYYLSGNRKKAVAQLERLLVAYPTSSAAHYFLGHIASNSGDYVQAIKHFEKALQLLESNADTIRLKHMGSGSNKDHLIATLKGEIRLANEKLVRR